MSHLADLTHSKGDIMRRLRELEQAVAALTTTRRLEASSIATGATTVRDNGAIRGASDAWRLEANQAVLNTVQVADGAIPATGVDGLRHTEVNGASGVTQASAGWRNVVLMGPWWANTVTIVALGEVSGVSGLSATITVGSSTSETFTGDPTVSPQAHVTLRVDSPRVQCRLDWQSDQGSQQVVSALTLIGTFWTDHDDGNQAE